MGSLTIDIRSAERRDVPGIAAVHDEAWMLAYTGIIPAKQLARMVQRRGPAWWDGAVKRLRGGLMVIAVADQVAGYATIGGPRRPGFDGEVYELYIKPEYQGLGFGARLFKAARERLIGNGRPRTIVWVLADNAPALAFYARLGGRIVAREGERFGEVVLPKAAFGFGI